MYNSAIARIASECLGLRRNGFEPADRRDGLAVDLGPCLDGGKPNPQTGEGPRTGGNREDIDLIQAAAAKGLEGATLLEQVKQLRGKRLTLRSADALEAIANFCQHRSSRPGE